jgi:divalent metal cation (Fe/Co/Zn/Cd) transporter
MSDDRTKGVPADGIDAKTWVRHFYSLALVTAVFHLLQFAASLALWRSTNSPALASFGLDAIVSSIAALVLAVRIHRSFDTISENWRSRGVAYGYIATSGVVLWLGVRQLWLGERPSRSFLGIGLAAVSMLVIPIIGSYMKTLAVELRNQTLKSAAIFTFGNSYLSMVLLIALLLNAGMNYPIGDALGALVMFPFLAQKGIQILLEEGKRDYVED